MKTFYENRKTDVVAVNDRLVKVVALARTRQPATVLDLACGRGALLKALRAALPEIRLTGADISEGSIAEVKSFGFEAFVVDVTRPFPFAEGAFDCVIFGEVIEHVIDPDATLLEIGRVLRLGGTLIVTTPNLASWYNRILLLLGIQPIFTETSLHVNLGRKFRFLGQWRETQGHIKIFTLAALKEMLTANGFVVDSVCGAAFLQPAPLWLVDKAFSYSPSLASNFIVQATNRKAVQTAYPGRVVANASLPEAARVR